MATVSVTPPLVQQKLEAFARLQPEFEACFQFLQDVHGQKRLPAFSVVDCVRYLHARWICECKSRLLSMAKTAQECDGRHCLELLRLWQEQRDTASIVAFLCGKLDMLPLASITRQIQELQDTSADPSLIPRLKHGRIVMLNRGMNLLQALETIFSLSEEKLAQAVQNACAEYGHLPDQIQQQLELMDTPLYSYVLHQALAQRNMLVMNGLGIHVTAQPADHPGQRSQKVSLPKEVLPPYAEEVINGYQEMTSVMFNNLLGKRFIDLPGHGISIAKGL
jgi:hypothetical protein